MRGDLALVKVADGTQQRLAGVPFKITSKTTGESHVIVTDGNGQASTAASWNAHTKDANGGTADSGVWFGGFEPDDAKGALPYDTYAVEELPCEANADRTLIPAFDVSVYRDSVTVNLWARSPTTRCQQRRLPHLECAPRRPTRTTATTRPWRTTR